MTEGPEETPNPLPPRIRVGPLNTARKVRRELARLYKALRNGEVPPKMAGTAAFVLGGMLKAIEVELVEERINGLEKQLRQPLDHDSRLLPRLTLDG